MRTQLDLGCTQARHDVLGINAIVNARGGMQHLNEPTIEDIEMGRDAIAIIAAVTRRVRWYGPTSKAFIRNRSRVAHLIASHDD